MATRGRLFYDQEFLVGDGSGRTGDCLRASVATLLQIDPVRVPHFSEFADWMGAVRCWRDDLAFRFRIRPETKLFPVEGVVGEWVVGCGRSPRGHLHAVVLSAVDGSLVHDPHPSRAGLIGPVGPIILTPDDGELSDTSGEESC